MPPRAKGVAMPQSTVTPSLSASHARQLAAWRRIWRILLLEEDETAGGEPAAAGKEDRDEKRDFRD